MIVSSQGASAIAATDLATRMRVLSDVVRRSFAGGTVGRDACRVGGEAGSGWQADEGCG
ncbi:hypothetical protein [Methylobacterium sp. J-030]|uniref:hypothetical protein n=1 Tax=Methylobacterium sp. J-030 TaxID=2836627 RepID=UPI001FB9A874|nr:hypothetical protein [Methylobacterium sp. J-030]